MSTAKVAVAMCSRSTGTKTEDRIVVVARKNAQNCANNAGITGRRSRETVCY